MGRMLKKLKKTVVAGSLAVLMAVNPCAQAFAQAGSAPQYIR